MSRAAHELGRTFCASAADPLDLSRTVRRHYLRPLPPLLQTTDGSEQGDVPQLGFLSKPSRPDVLVMASSTSFDRLPAELLSDVLQRLPAKDLCRLRSVCRSWRTLLTSDAAFIKAHAERHREPLFLAKFIYDQRYVYVVDLSGNVVKRIAGAVGGYQVVRTRLKLACLATEWNRCHLLNPATGCIRVLPLIPAMDYEGGLCLTNPCTFFGHGLAASTGEYKLLRCRSQFVENSQHRVQVLTINGGGTGWRPRPGPRCFLDMHSGIVVDGVAYFLIDTASVELFYDTNEPADNILSFDLATEEWRRDLHGPLSTTGNVPPAELRQDEPALADLKGSLVLAHRRRHLSTLDIWFLQDFESGLWVKEYSIRTESVTPNFADIRHLIPLLVLNDGRLVIYVAPIGLLFICDPGTNTFTKVHMGRRLDSVSLYTGNLLSLQLVAML